MSQELPPIGTKAVHKDDYEKTQGPVWEVTEHLDAKVPNPPAGCEVLIGLGPAKHKLNTTPVSPKCVSPEDFQDNYKVL